MINLIERGNFVSDDCFPWRLDEKMLNNVKQLSSFLSSHLSSASSPTLSHFQQSRHFSTLVIKCPTG